MDEIINKIINIDKETVSMKLKTEEIVADKERTVKEILQKIEKEYMEEGRLEGERIYKEIIKDGEEEIKRSEAQDIEILESIENIYKVNKDKLIDGLWNKLFRGEE